MKKLDELVEKVELVDVFLKTQNGGVFVAPRMVDPAHVLLEFEFKNHFEKIGKDAIVAYFSINVLAKESGKTEKNPKKIFEMFVEFGLVYSTKKIDGIISDEVIGQFMMTTGVLNAYPYLRESVQSLSCKFGVPPVIAPLLKFPQKTKKKKGKVK